MTPRETLGTIGGVDAVHRLERAVKAEARMWPDQEPPNRAQIAMVLHALADHTAIQHAQTFSLDEDSPWPASTSIGRFLHAYGDRFDAACITDATPPREKTKWPEPTLDQKLLAEELIPFLAENPQAPVMVENDDAICYIRDYDTDVFSKEEGVVIVLVQHEEDV